MTPTDLQAEIIEVLRSYWRIRSALGYLKGNSKDAWKLAVRLEYGGVPQVGVTVGFLESESLGAALQEVDNYQTSRLENDIFLTLISRLEVFLSAKLASVPLVTTGTLGQLQGLAERHFRVGGAEVCQINEIRERRNISIHHQGKATLKYIQAVSIAVAHSSGHVSVPGIGGQVDVTPLYLSYASDAIIRYGRLYPSKS